jgi:hypothetical protein
MSKQINSIDDEWSKFIQSSSNTGDDEDVDEEEQESNSEDFEVRDGVIPEPSPIYISTKSKIAYLNGPIDLNVFWCIPVVPYATPLEGVIKKQIKSNTTTVEDFNLIQDMLTKEAYYEEHIITSINNPGGRIKFKDSRKITIGMSKKDIMCGRGKKKSAFYNCFVIILRICVEEVFREFHIKVFNTGELDIPGIQNDAVFDIVLQTVIDTLQPFIDRTLEYTQTSETILINSNFNCGFFINREILCNLLRTKYNIQSIYDSCSYPGIQSKFYYNNSIHCTEQTGVQTVDATDTYTRVAFMIFRTGSVLIVGKCDEVVLNHIYAFLVRLLKTEYYTIWQHKSMSDLTPLKDKKKKTRKKMITITEETNEEDGVI